MMQMMQMMGGQPPGIGMIDHVEGRIAFLRAELKITDAQDGVWNAFADALRTNAKKLGEAGALMMPRPGAAQPQAPTLAQRLDVQERWFAAQLDGTRAIKAAFTKLNDAFSDEQKKAADELLAPNMGMGMGMMAMMPMTRSAPWPQSVSGTAAKFVDSASGRAVSRWSPLSIRVGAASRETSSTMRDRTKLGWHVAHVLGIVKRIWGASSDRSRRYLILFVGYPPPHIYGI